MKKTSNEIFADFYDSLSTGVSRMSKAFGVHKDVAKAWSRAKASLENPTATGKGNPVTQAERAVRVIYPHDPSRAREIPAFLEWVIDELDREAGIFEAEEEENPCAAILRVVQHQMKLISVSYGNCFDDSKLPEFLNETRQMKTNVNRLESCLKSLINKKEKSER